MVAWHHHFQAELATVKQLFDVHKAELPRGALLPSHAGRAALLRGLLLRIEGSWDHLQALAPNLPPVAQAAESAAAYEALHSGLQQCRNQLNSDWFGGVSAQLEARLGDNLLRQDRAGSGVLAVNLAAEVAGALEEALLFERTRLGVPHAAAVLLEHRARLRSLQVCATGVARLYNALLGGLAREERRLFRDRLRCVLGRVGRGGGAMRGGGRRWGAQQSARQSGAAHSNARALAAPPPPAPPQGPGPPRAAGGEQAELGQPPPPDRLLLQGRHPHLPRHGRRRPRAARRQRRGGAGLHRGARLAAVARRPPAPVLAARV